MDKTRIRLLFLLVLLAGLLMFRLSRDRRPTGERTRLSNTKVGRTAVGTPTVTSAARPRSPTPPPQMRRVSIAPGMAVVFNGRRYLHAARADEALEAVCAKLDRQEQVPVLLGMSADPGPAVRAALSRHGTDVAGYLPDYGWLARVHDASIRELADWITLAVELDASDKLAPSLLKPPTCDQVPVYVHVWPDTRGDSLVDTLHALGLKGLRACSAGPLRYLAGTVPARHMQLFRDIVGPHPETVLAERAYGAKLMNNYSTRILQSGSYTGSTPFWDAGVYGSNQVIAVLDTGCDVDSGFYRDASGTLPPTNNIHGTNVNLSLRKVIAADFLYPADKPSIPTHWDNQGHGTRVAGHALGDDLADPFGKDAYNGMAPAAKLIVQDGGFTTLDNCADLVGLGCPVTNYYPALNQAVAQGARIHNNSWGDREEFTPHNTYTEPCRELDLVAWSNREFLVVCAAGNDGGSDTVSSPSTAKNGLSVGACNPASGQESIASFSSRGWTDDGRYKPDLTAPGGWSVYSSSSDGTIISSNTTVASGAGTSYSSPMVAGMAALVRDYFAQGFYPTGEATPSNAMPSVSAALVKAVLINSCTNVLLAATPPPSRDQGWGRVKLSQTLPLGATSNNLLVCDSDAVFTSGASPGKSFYLDIGSTGTPLRVTLVWTDYPATPGAGRQLVNDLDLNVRAPGIEMAGNSFANGWSVPGSAFDRSNNVEQVLWHPAVTGLVEIVVSPHLVPQPPQDFALVVTGAFSAWDTARDDDGDELPDAWELHYLGDLGETGADDTDHDGVSNRGELIAGTDPADPADRLEIRAATAPGDGSNLVLQWNSTSGRLYHLLLRETLQDAQWTTGAAGIPATAPMNTVTVQTGTAETRFYRVGAKRTE